MRATVTQGVRAQLGILEKVAGGGSKPKRREKAIAALSGLVGAMVVARLVDDPSLSNEILTASAAAFGGNPRDSQGRSDAARKRDGADHRRQ